MAKLGALPAKNIIDAFRGTLDFYTWCSLNIVRKWPRAPGRARAPAVVAAQAPFAYINKLAGSLSASVIESYQELAQDSALSWKDFLNRLYINASIEDHPSPADEDYVLSSEKTMRIQLLDPEAQILDIDFEDTSHPWTDIDLSALVPASATHAIIRTKLQWNAAAADGAIDLYAREKGTTLRVPCCGQWTNRTGGIQRNNDILVGLDANKVIQYKLTISVGLNDVWADMWLLGYYYEGE